MQIERSERLTLNASKILMWKKLLYSFEMIKAVCELLSCLQSIWTDGSIDGQKEEQIKAPRGSLGGGQKQTSYPHVVSGD